MLMKSHFDFKEPVAPGLRKKGKKAQSLTLNDKVQVAHKVIVEHHLQQEVAKEYRVSPVVVNQLIKKVMRNTSFL